MTSTLLDQLIEPFAECLAPEAARKIAAIQADEALQTRVDFLADKANWGTLTADEQAEYDRYLAAFHFVTLLQAKARRLLRD